MDASEATGIADQTHIIQTPILASAILDDYHHDYNLKATHMSLGSEYLSWAETSRREQKFVTIAKWAIVALLAKVLASILFEYTRYFPADFDSDFLAGRSDYFYGLYGVAFYIHIVSGPVALIAGAFLMFSGKKARFQKFHRLLGKPQAFIVVGLVVPSGLVMATKSIAGPAAGVGLAIHGLVTAACMILAVYFVTQRQIARHRRWATRCFLLLCAPLLLRLINGAAITVGIETEAVYIVNAWFSWIAPLVGFECFRKLKSNGNRNALFPFRFYSNSLVQKREIR